MNLNFSDCSSVGLLQQTHISRNSLAMRAKALPTGQSKPQSTATMTGRGRSLSTYAVGGGDLQTNAYRGKREVRPLSMYTIFKLSMSSGIIYGIQILRLA